MHRLNSRGMQAGSNEIMLRHGLLLILICPFLLFCGRRVFTRPHTKYHIYCTVTKPLHISLGYVFPTFFSVLTRKIPVHQVLHGQGITIVVNQSDHYHWDMSHIWASFSLLKRRYSVECQPPGFRHRVHIVKKFEFV